MLKMMLAKPILAFVVALASAAAPGSDRPQDGQRFFLTCIGTMRTVGTAASPIAANGFVDLVGRRVSGFGIGSAAILVLTDTLIGFGSPGSSGGNRVEGSLDRRSGKARIAVLSTREPAEQLIVMELDCRPAPSIS